MNRVLVGLLTALLAWLGLAVPPDQAFASPILAVHTYAYDGQHNGSLDTARVLEQAPPTAYHRHRISDTITNHDPMHHVQVARVGARTEESARVSRAGLSPLIHSQVAANTSDDVLGLATRNISNSGDTVIGHFPGYITKANSKGASYFDIGEAWSGLTPSQRWAANRHFLDTRIAAGDRVLLSVPKGDIRPGSYLAQEVQYLTSNGDVPLSGGLSF